MSLNLPSFAQAFPHHIPSIPQSSNALPPIQMPSKKRVHEEPEVKQEDPTPDDSDDHSPAPSQSIHSPVKKRRVTVSGSAPQPLRIDVRPTQDQSANTPISPVVMGFTIQRGDPEAFEQLRSSMSVKQKQKALIEQRRGSAGGPPSPTSAAAPELRAPSKQHPAPPVPTSSQQPSQQSQSAPRSTRRSPNNMTTPNNPPTPAQPSRRATNQRGSSPQPPPQPQPPQQTHAASHSLAPPPISFARRRAAQFGAKKKPADILINPRERELDTGHPTIQSAPPSQTTFFTGRFPTSMSLPRLPQIVPSSDRRPTGNVPPTPTRLSGLQVQAQSQLQSQSALGTARSPPAASVPIASTLVPPTPTSLHRPGYSGDKAAFLAPFEIFYDALNDSKQMKQWLNDQLQRSNALMQSLTQQQDRLNETVDSLVEKRTAGMKTELLALRKRVDELEDAVRSRNTMPSVPQPIKPPQPLLQNGSGAEPYTFPPVSDPESSRRRGSSPARDRDRRPTPDYHANTGSPVPFDARRMSTSATRLDPPPQSSSRSGNIQSPPLAYRERERGMASHSSAPPIARQNSVADSKDKERGREKEEGRSTPASSRRQAGSRRNSIVMAPPESESS